MIIPLISTIWLATLMLVVAACRMAAHGDRTAARDAQLHLDDARSPSLLDLQVPWEGEVILRLSDSRTQPPEGGRSKAAAAEHVWDRAQEDLYVRP
jgi:hypothetical protein